jgi:heme exporter protein D
MDLGPHAGFIEIAYAVTAIIVVSLIAWVVLDYRAQRRHLDGLEASGVRRRSDRASRIST